MQIKAADDKTPDLDVLRALLGRSDVNDEQRQRIDREIRNIQSGLRGEQDAAYEIEFHYGQSRNWISIHDLRLQCDGRVAQIDHLLINRVLEIYVCESKRFAEGVAINEQGEFTAFFGGKAYGVPSPLEQNRRHISVLESVFKTGQVPLPRRLGLAIKPSMIGLVLVSKNARISRPTRKINGLDAVIKNDQLRSRIDKDIDSDNNPLGFARLVSQETLEELARAIASQHRPARMDWLGKFGLPPVAPAQTPIKATTAAPRPEASGRSASPRNNTKLLCAACGATVSYAVAKFCWVNKSRFAGLVYCMDCQRRVPKPP
jgi:hypothetical protein